MANHSYSSEYVSLQRDVFASTDNFLVIIQLSVTEMYLQAFICFSLSFLKNLKKTFI